MHSYVFLLSTLVCSRSRRRTNFLFETYTGLMNAQVRVEIAPRVLKICEPTSTNYEKAIHRRCTERDSRLYSRFIYYIAYYHLILSHRKWPV